MVDFSKLLSTPLDNVKPPKVLPDGTFSAVIKRYEFLPAPEGKDYNAIIRFHIGLVDWPEATDDADKMEDRGSGLVPIDLSKRQMRRDFYDNSLHRLVEFVKSCGVEISGRVLEEALPDVVGARVKAHVQQYLNKNTNELGNQIGELAGE